MPWKAKDAGRFTKKAKTKTDKTVWTEVANSVLSKTGDEARAIKQANAVIRRRKGKSK